MTSRPGQLSETLSQDRIKNCQQYNSLVEYLPSMLWSSWVQCQKEGKKKILITYSLDHNMGTHSQVDPFKLWLSLLPHGLYWTQNCMWMCGAELPEEAASIKDPTNRLTLAGQNTVIVDWWTDSQGQNYLGLLRPFTSPLLSTLYLS